MMMNEGPVCKTCVVFKRHKDKCWYYWDHKKACTQYRGSDVSDPVFLEIDEWGITQVLRTVQ